MNAKHIRTPELAAVDTATLAVLVRAGVPMHILDARAGEYDDGRRIPGARSLPVKTTASEVEEAIGSKDALVVTYCTNLQCPASMALYKHLRNLGYENVLDYPDGIEGWQAAGYSVEQAVKT